MLKTILKPFASLTLTVVLLAMSMLLIYVGTGAQIYEGIWQVQKSFFHSYFCWLPIHTLLLRAGPPNEVSLFGGTFRFVPAIPMLGGYVVGALLLVNLLSAHIVRFKFSL